MPQSSNEPESNEAIESLVHDSTTHAEIVSTKTQQFNELSEFLHKWFYKPDMDAVKICLSAYASHLYLSDDPVWLFIVGPPGSGKTSIAIRSVSFLDGTEYVDELTTSSFLSGFGENNGILGRLTKYHNGNGVLLFPDFTQILAQPQEKRDTIVGQMRRIYDGSFSKDVGNKEEKISWEGKVSCLAAVTPTIENYWSINRSLGERFMYLRWRSGDPRITAQYAKKQVGKELYIRSEFKRLVEQYVSMPEMKKVEVDPEEDLGLDGLAEIVSRLRVTAHREAQGSKRVLMGLDEPELPTRIAKALTMIARGSATLDRRAVIDFYDIQLAKRMAIDTIPRTRRKLLEPLFNNMHYEQTIEELKLKTGYQNIQIQRVLEELRVIGAVEITEGVTHKWVSLTKWMIDGLEESLVVKIDDGITRVTDVP